MEKLLTLIRLEPLRGGRTKAVLIVDALLYAVAILLPEYISPALWTKLQPIFGLIGGYFGIEHFENKS